MGTGCGSGPRRRDHQAIVVSRAHERYFGDLVRDVPPGRLIVQPENRGTAPGVLYPLIHVTELAGDVPLAILPSDHYVSDDHAFMAYVPAAVEVVRLHPDLVVLLGIEPARPETAYGGSVRPRRRGRWTGTRGSGPRGWTA
jgi:mannose-1-phosphate guanylyltransferase